MKALSKRDRGSVEDSRFTRADSKEPLTALFLIHNKFTIRL